MQEAALKEKEEQLLLLRSRNDSLISSTILPAVGEKRQVQMSSIKLSVEAQIEGLLEEFRKARADADDDMPSIIELYKAKMKTIFEEVRLSARPTYMLTAQLKCHRSSHRHRYARPSLHTRSSCVVARRHKVKQNLHSGTCFLQTSRNE